MSKVLATVFAFNAASLAFFHKHDFRTDDTSPAEGTGLDYFILSRDTPRATATDKK
jgi:L-amino acid N-acyltransferase YncA